MSLKFYDIENKKVYIRASIFGKPLEVIEFYEDDMECIVLCPNCGQKTKYGQTRMISGNVGCDNKLPDGRECYFDDLVPRIIK